MARVTLTASAHADIAAILTDLAEQASELVAEKYNHSFLTLYDRLGKFPATGALRSGLGPDIRIGIVAPYVLVYHHAEEDLVTILRVLHGKRDITKALLLGR